MKSLSNISGTLSGMSEIAMNALKWMAVHVGAKYPILSTVVVVVVVGGGAGFGWVSLFHSLNENRDAQKPTVEQHSHDPKCGNIEVTGGLVDCKIEEKPSVPEGSSKPDLSNGSK